MGRWKGGRGAEDEEAKLERGDPIVVERVDSGSTLTVRRAEELELF